MKAVTVARADAVTTRRRRRSTDEILRRIEQAACDEFERCGYTGARTAAIAQRAGVAESLIFNHFGSKAALFQAVIFNPLERHFRAFHAEHAVSDGDRAQLQTGSRQYVLELQQLIERHAGMLTSLLVANLHEGDERQAGIPGLENFFDSTAMALRERLAERATADVALAARVSFATVLASILFRRWLFPADIASDEQLRAAVSEFVMAGFNASIEI